MKRLLTFLTLLTVFIGVGWASESYVTLSWEGANNDGNTQLSTNVVLTSAATYNGDEDIATCTNAQRLYVGKDHKGLKIGASSNAGDLSLSLIPVIKPTRVVFNLAAYSTSNGVTVTAKLNDGSAQTLLNNSKNVTLTDVELPMDGDTELNSINVHSSKYSFLKSITIYYEEGGTPSSLAQPTITLDPASGPYYEGDDVTATLACETQGATIYYKLNNDASWTEYSAPLTLNQTTTIHAKAVLGTDESSEKTELVSFGKSASTVAEILSFDNNDYFKFRGNLVVSGRSGSNVYAQDATGGIHLYGSNLSIYSEGDVIPSGFIAKLNNNYYGAPELTNFENIQEAESTTSLTAQPIIPSQIGNNNLEQLFIYAVINNATVSGTTITANGETVALYNTFNITIPNDGKTYNIYGITSYYNNPQFLPLRFEEVTVDPGDGYYLVGTFNMNGNDWVAKDASYKFSGEGTTLTLNNVNLPDNVQFKIVKWEGSTQTWYGGQTDDTNQQNPYGLHRDWHTNIPLTNSYNNNYVKNFSIAAGAVTNFTLNTSTLKFDVQRDEQLYVKGDFNEWGKTPMNSTSTGWTINQAISAEDEFGFVDEWGDWHGGNGYWIYQEEHEAFGETKPSDIGQELDITSSGNFYMVTAGTYTLNVNSNLTKLVVYVPLAINCTATSDVEGKAGGTVVAKVEGNTVTAAQTGETVVLEVTPWNGYTLSSVTLNGSALTANEGVYSFEMPNVAANVVANFTVNYYDLVLQNDETLGEVSGLPQNMKAYTGQEVSFSVIALGENEIDKVTYEYNGGNPQTLTATEGTYKFNMPPFEVTIKVTYIEPLQPCTIRFEESWPETAGTGGNDEVWSTSGNSPAAVSQNLGWIYKDGDTEFQGYGADNCIRIGKRNGAGSATTPEIIVTNGTIYKMTFRAGGWTSDNTTINLSAEGAELFSDANCTTSVETETITNEAWTEFEVYVKATSSLMRITWAAPPTRSRFFLDDVVIDYFETPTPTEATLAQIITLGENADGKLYKISNEDGLLGVYSQGQSVWFKDEYPEQAVDYQDPLENTNYKYYTVVEDALEINKSEKDFDQSNWIEVVFQDNASYNNKYVKNLTGTYSWQNGNPKLTLTVDVDETNDVTDVPVGALAYDLNPYMAANFAGTQDGTIQGETHTYFFSKPKAQEYAQILWAVWDGSKFNMPTTNNAYGFTGSFTVSDELNGGVSLDGLQQGKTYNFKAVIRKTASKAGSYEVYPTDLNPGVVTGVGMINVNGNVKSVKYVNVAGIVSDVPFQGVNIVVTEYTDGSRTTTKMLKK